MFEQDVPVEPFESWLAKVLTDYPWILDPQIESVVYEISDAVTIKRTYPKPSGLGSENLAVASSTSLIPGETNIIASICDGKETGWLIIDDVSSEYSNWYKGEAWIVTDAYLNSEFSHQMILFGLLTYVVQSCGVGMIRIKTATLDQLSKYFRLYGFTYAWTVGDGTFSIATQAFLESASKARNSYWLEHQVNSQ